MPRILKRSTVRSLHHGPRPAFPAAADPVFSLTPPLQLPVRVRFYRQIIQQGLTGPAFGQLRPPGQTFTENRVTGLTFN